MSRCYFHPPQVHEVQTGYAIHPVKRTKMYELTLTVGPTSRPISTADVEFMDGSFKPRRRNMRFNKSAIPGGQFQYKIEVWGPDKFNFHLNFQDGGCITLPWRYEFINGGADQPFILDGASVRMGPGISCDSETA